MKRKCDLESLVSCSLNFCPESPINPRDTMWKEETSYNDDLNKNELVFAKLRKLAHDCLQKNQISTLTFYADKLVIMSKGQADDVWLLCQAYYLSQEYHRAIETLKIYKYIDGELTPEILRFRYLALQCMIANKDWGECFSLFKGTLKEDEKSLLMQSRSCSHKKGEEVNLISSLCVLRGNAYEATENREKASLWYQRALKCDVYCTEAFFNLIDRHMLSSQEEMLLFTSLDFDESDEWLRLYYASNIGKYFASPSVKSKFHSLETDYGLEKSLELAVTKAKCYYYQHATEKAYTISKWIREKDPFHLTSVPVYVSTLVDLKKNSELFYCAHRLVEYSPEQEISWFAVGCYYFLVKKFSAAQRYFEKSTTLNPNFAPSWIGYGNAYAAQDESDHAMASYRTASRIFPGSHLPLLCIGMEYLRTNNLTLAYQYIQQAADICPADPLVYNELGAVCYRQGRYQEAVELFEKTLELCFLLPKKLLEKWEPTVMNLAQAYRKLKLYSKAISIYQQSLALSPKNASTYAALGFTYHLQGNLDLAIDCYHKALALKPGDSFTTEMLSRALDEAMKDSNSISRIQTYRNSCFKEIESNQSFSMDISNSMDRSRNSDLLTYNDGDEEDDDDMSL